MKSEKIVKLSFGQTLDEAERGLQYANQVIFQSKLKVDGVLQSRNCSDIDIEKSETMKKSD